MKCNSCHQLIIPKKEEKQTHRVELLQIDGKSTLAQWKISDDVVSVETETDHFTLRLSTHPEAQLFFHKECFEGLAGDEFTETIRNNTDKCLMCLSGERRIDKTGRYPRKGVICDECAAIAPSCSTCTTQMTLKFSNKNSGIFWSCPNYPKCTGTKSVI